MIFKKSKDLQVYEEKDDTPKTNTDFVDYDGHQGHHIHQSKMFDMEFYDSQKNSFGVYSRVIKECDEVTLLKILTTYLLRLKLYIKVILIIKKYILMCLISFNDYFHKGINNSV